MCNVTPACSEREAGPQKSADAAELREPAGDCDCVPGKVRSVQMRQSLPGGNGRHRSLVGYFLSAANVDCLDLFSPIIPFHHSCVQTRCMVDFCEHRGLSLADCRFHRRSICGICCEKLKTKYCTERTAAVVIGTVSVLACSENIPWGFVYEPLVVIDGVPWYCVYTSSYKSSPSWAAFAMFHRILTPCVPFFLILLLNIRTVRKILAASRARRGLRTRRNGENDQDREMENRRKSIVLLFSITGSFILCTVTPQAFYIYQRISMSFIYYSVTDPRYLTEEISGMLQILSSCTNTFIYALTQSRFREELRNMLIFPLNRILKFG
ncbi:uncharacterized protein [Mobula birostris]